MKLSNIGLIGLGVMGVNLARNIEGKGYRVSVYNRPHDGKTETVDRFKKLYSGDFYATGDIQDFVASLETPRKIFLMVSAGKAVDDVIATLVPLLSKGDIVIDGGNSDYRDTARRVAEMEDFGFLYVGAGVSGGGSGALRGPSIMPSGSPEAWPKIKNIFKTISAKADDGAPCCRWLGSGGAGHFVKTVHNAIEYSDMQLIAEAYHILKNCNGFTDDEISGIFSEWNCGELKSYLVEITSKILRVKDDDGSALVEKILDAASQKGTGKCAVKSALDLGGQFGIAAQAVFARFVSAMPEERVRAARAFPDRLFRGDCDGITKIDVGGALLASKVAAYAQGFALLREASDANGWNLDLASVARIWRKGCIIRSVFLDKIAAAYASNPKLENIIFDSWFAGILKSNMLSWRRVVSGAVFGAMPIPCMAAALEAFDSLRTAQSSANIIQAQRDYFGAHTYERVDKPRGKFFHTDWESAELRELPKKQ